MAKRKLAPLPPLSSLEVPTPPEELVPEGVYAASGDAGDVAVFDAVEEAIDDAQAVSDIPTGVFAPNPAADPVVPADIDLDLETVAPPKPSPKGGFAVRRLKMEHVITGATRDLCVPVRQDKSDWPVKRNKDHKSLERVLSAEEERYEFERDRDDVLRSFGYRGAGDPLFRNDEGPSPA